VLRDDMDVGVLFEIGQREMRGIGLRRQDAAPALVVEAQHRCRIALPGLGGGNILDAMLLPQPVAGAKGFQAALGADAGTAEHDDGLHVTSQSPFAPRTILRARQNPRPALRGQPPLPKEAYGRSALNIPRATRESHGTHPPFEKRVWG